MTHPAIAENPRVVAKTLSRVEVDASASNQHELHAGLLRKSLGLPADRSTGRLVIAYIEADDIPPTLDEDRYTISDVRREKVDRSPEWHLYYYSDLLQKLAQAGDLLVILRPRESSTDLLAVVARGGTKAERDLRSALDLGDSEVVKRFRLLHPVRAAFSAADSMAADHAAITTDEIVAHPLFRTAITLGTLPSTADMAAASQEIVAGRVNAHAEPDQFLIEALDTETALFSAMERAIGTNEYEALLESGGEFSEVITLVMSLLQRRKSRRGYSLENHLAGLFDQLRIPYSRQCQTESGKPDFVLPGCAYYHDPSYPSDRLRMVGCKSKLRERWSQYSREATRIHPKYHVSLDPDIGDALLEKMHVAGLCLFMPQSLIERYYEGQTASGLVAPIHTLIDNLRSA